MKQGKLLKSKKGITLVALVVTIVVLLILAGVSINLVIGNNGLITKAQKARETYSQSATNEGEEIGDVSAMINNILDNAGALVGFTITFLLATGAATAYAVKNNQTTISFPEQNPTNDGKTFTGWYYDENCTNPANENTTLTKDTILYAGWEENVAQNNSIVNPYNGKELVSAPIGSLPSSYNWHEDDGYGGYRLNDSTYLMWTTSKNISNVSLSIEDNQVYTGDNPSEIFFVEVKSETSIKFYRKAASQPITGDKVKFKIGITYEDGTQDEDSFYLTYSYINKCCFAAGTLITLKNGAQKKVEDITYNDELLVWDFDNGCFSSSKPLWIKKCETANEYNLLKFEKGIELKTIDQHRIFNKELNKFTYPMTDETPIGTTTFLCDGTEVKLLSKEVVKEQVDYYNIISDYHMNIFANNILTSCRLNNLYPIKDMKFIKDSRKLAKREEYPDIPDEYYYGLRVAEQPNEINRGNDVKHVNNITEYVQNIISLAKPRE